MLFCKSVELKYQLMGGSKSEQRYRDCKMRHAFSKKESFAILRT